MNVFENNPERQERAENEIARHVQEQGFELCGITSVDDPPKAQDGLKKFLNNNWHGSMDWMARNPDRRASPTTLWPDAKSIVVAGMNYGPELDPLLSLSATSNGTISVYAQGKDYHDVLKKRLKSIGRWIHKEFNSEVKVFVDTAPVMEKPLAAAAGFGWQGKHTNLVSKNYGSWLFIGSIFTTLELRPSAAHEDRCGTCQACLTICPTKAFPGPYQLDAAKCISYLTIEHKTHIPLEFRKPIGNRIYGCDDCLAICPWNKFAQQAKTIDLQAREGLVAPKLGILVNLDDAQFRQMFAGTAIKRIGRDRFIRNVLIAIGNSNDPSLLEFAEERLTDPSPLVRAMAVWACGQLASPRQLQILHHANANAETDADVLNEWLICISAN